MTVIYLAKVRAARTALNLAESMSSDPVLRAAARARALGQVMRREQRLKQPQLAEVVFLDTRMAELRKSLRRRAKAQPRDY